MEYRENALSYEDYYTLRKSVGWNTFSKEQAKNALNNSLYTVTAVENKKTAAMGRLIGDGQYYMIVDVIVHPDYQKQKIGTSILNMLLTYVHNHTHEDTHRNNTNHTVWTPFIDYTYIYARHHGHNPV